MLYAVPLIHTLIKKKGFVYVFTMEAEEKKLKIKMAKKQRKATKIERSLENWSNC